MKLKTHFFILAIVTFILLRCSTAGSDLVQIKVLGDLRSTEIGNTLSANAINSSEVTFTVARIAIEDLEIEQQDDCEGESERELEIKGPIVVDLLNQKTYPELERFELSQGDYCYLSFTFDNLEDELPEGIDAADPLVEYSVFIQGKIQGIDFILRISESDEVEIENETGTFRFDPLQVDTLFLVIGLSQLFEGLEFNDLDQEDGLITIDQDTNDDAYSQIRENLINFSTLREDEDGDDELDEDDDILADGDDELDEDDEDDEDED